MATNSLGTRLEMAKQLTICLKVDVPKSFYVAIFQMEHHCILTLGFIMIAVNGNMTILDTICIEVTSEKMHLTAAVD